VIFGIGKIAIIIGVISKKVLATLKEGVQEMTFNKGINKYILRSKKLYLI
tara:strand:+ start:358 stop:507 length:150 start_codon:yes stop_codon:yes gene_type:complete